MAAPAALIQSAEAAIAQFLPNASSASFAIHCAAYLRGRESLRRRPPETADKAAAAAHEAGHGVCAAAFGVPLEGARLFEHERGWGGCVQPGPSPQRSQCITPQLIGETIVCALGGYAGEQSIGRSGLHSSAHEIAIAFYLCKASPLLFPGVPALGALRAGLTCAKDCVAVNADSFKRLRSSLADRTSIEAGELVGLVANVRMLDPEAWVHLARSGGGALAHPFEEECFDVAGAIAQVIFSRDANASLRALA